jgi:SNF2 family DNA or RNA helicase
VQQLGLEVDEHDDVKLPKRPESLLKCVTVGKGLQVPVDIAEKLFPYQMRGVHWLAGLHDQGTGGVLADEMGLGKTAQLIALFAGLKVVNALGPSIVVCPATVMSHWIRCACAAIARQSTT